jgi:hypothetical protein
LRNAGTLMPTPLLDRDAAVLPARSAANGSTDGTGALGEQNDFIEETRAFWQSRTDRVLTREDAREIIENMTGFFRVLLEWDRAKRSKPHGGSPK